MTIIKNVTDFP